ncbi:MAG: hypothetical protein M3R02_23390 [Chloroflexota bacterium]|nr:hypothetical protein [Chloroflexota bacterium]
MPIDPDDMERVLREVAADAGMTFEDFMALSGEEARAAFGRSIAKEYAQWWDATAREMAQEAVRALWRRAQVPEGMTSREAHEHGYVTEADLRAALAVDPEAVTVRADATYDPPKSSGEPRR